MALKVAKRRTLEQAIQGSCHDTQRGSTGVCLPRESPSKSILLVPPDKRYLVQSQPCLLNTNHSYRCLHLGQSQCFSAVPLPVTRGSPPSFGVCRNSNTVTSSTVLLFWSFFSLDVWELHGWILCPGISQVDHVEVTAFIWNPMSSFKLTALVDSLPEVVRMKFPYSCLLGCMHLSLSYHFSFSVVYSQMKIHWEVDRCCGCMENVPPRAWAWTFSSQQVALTLLRFLNT